MKENRRKGNSRLENLGRKKQAPPPPATKKEFEYSNLESARLVEGKVLITGVVFSGVTNVVHSPSIHPSGFQGQVSVEFNPDTKELLFAFE